MWIKVWLPNLNLHTLKFPLNNVSLSYLCQKQTNKYHQVHWRREQWSWSWIEKMRPWRLLTRQLKLVQKIEVVQIGLYRTFRSSRLIVLGGPLRKERTWPPLFCRGFVLLLHLRLLWVYFFGCVWRFYHNLLWGRGVCQLSKVSNISPFLWLP